MYSSHNRGNIVLYIFSKFLPFLVINRSSLLAKGIRKPSTLFMPPPPPEYDFWCPKVSQTPNGFVGNKDESTLLGFENSFDSLGEYQWTKHFLYRWDMKVANALYFKKTTGSLHNFLFLIVVIWLVLMIRQNKSLSEFYLNVNPFLVRNVKNRWR